MKECCWRVQALFFTDQEPVEKAKKMKVCPCLNPLMKTGDFDFR